MSKAYRLFIAAVFAALMAVLGEKAQFGRENGAVPFGTSGHWKVDWPNNGPVPGTP